MNVKVASRSASLTSGVGKGMKAKLAFAIAAVEFGGILSGGKAKVSGEESRESPAPDSRLPVFT